MGLKHRLYRAVSRLDSWTREPDRVGLRILLYHAVGTPLADDPYGTSISPVLFEAHMRRLAELGERLECVPFGVPKDRAQICVTFDDGYRDALTRAAPILSGLGIPLTLFATTQFIRDPGSLYLSVSELKKLADMPFISIGSHGCSHSRLTALNDADLRRELRDSRSRLEDWIGRPITALSYPHGAVDRRVRDEAEAAGYLVAACSRYGLNRSGRDPLLLCRTEITSQDRTEDFLLKALGHWDWFRFRHRDPAA